MSSYPPAHILLEAVSAFLREEMVPAVDGARKFKLRVAINALDMIRREMNQERGADDREQRRLQQLLHGDGDLDDLRAQLCDAIKHDRIATDDADFWRHLRATAIDRLAIDQPGYSAYRAAIDNAT